MTQPLSIIVAIGRNGAIGSHNCLPWRLPSDLRHFRSLTMGRPVIMGRKTYASIGRPLAGRALVVVSGNPGFRPSPEVAVAADPDSAIAHAEALATKLGAEEIMVAGGATLYRALIGRARRLYVTEVDLAPEADTFFPAIDPARWQEVSRLPQPRASNDDASLAFVTYERR